MGGEPAAAGGIGHAPIQPPAQPASILTATRSEQNYGTSTLDHNPGDKKTEAQAKQTGQKPAAAQAAGEMIGAENRPKGRLGGPLAERGGFVPGRPDVQLAAAMGNGQVVQQAAKGRWHGIGRFG